MANVGDLVEVKTEKSVEKGILMPSPDENSIIIKLDNGYNMGFEKKNVQEIKVLKEKTISEEVKKEAVKPKEGLKTISILHCGGTIASKVDYETGAVKPKFSPEDLLEMFPELSNIVNLRSKAVANMLSENMVFAHYNLIAKEIEKEIKAGSEGIIVTHGTDFLHYTAAALSLILENLSVPVILVGAQRSSDRGSSDAFLNLRCAAQFIVNSDFCDVALCMHNSAEDDKCVIIPAVKARKMHSSRRDAFKTINGTPYALVDAEGGIIWLTESKDKSNGKLELKLFNEKLKVGLLKAHPQMFAEEVKAYSNFDGLLLEGSGIGHFPILKYDDLTGENEKLFSELKKLTAKIPVALTTQTIFGMVNMNVYAPGRDLIDIGVLGNGLDMTTETAYLKLAWLLSNYPDKVKEMFSENLRGEISDKRSYEKEFC
jgi:glutamyl-tRNA(Gln) amidotransferase subunit D